MPSEVLGSWDSWQMPAMPRTDTRFAVVSRSSRFPIRLAREQRISCRMLVGRGGAASREDIDAWEIRRALTARFALDWLKADASGGMVSTRQSCWRGQYGIYPLPTRSPARVSVETLMVLSPPTRTKH